MSLESVEKQFFIAVLCFLSLMMLLCMIRGLKGPRITDRIVAVNMIGTITMAAIAILSFVLNESYLLDICLIYAMISFLAVVILVKIYMGAYNRRKQDGEEDLRRDD